MAQNAWRKAGQRPELFQQIDHMLERIRRDRGSGSEILDFKAGLGGIIEAEFLVQALQLRAGVWNPQFHFAVDDLQRAGVFAEPDATALKESYDLLRRCEAVLRRWENKSVATLPADEGEQEKLARRLGAKDLATFGEQYRGARERIHLTHARYFGAP